eukprot:CAMPEP_0202473134 /NCGR_PEP_ID=MMETSP1360-20130828/89993_1 /ASSEMBLY_ACC=CAM_ASM_000848 /TAXON_ID=515479 /ORGANISM="Licmophora paradoxa, Strain CCMP2313" /LENGTH=173 /DNA_ID=CAMNT_0049099907 /DNA_START=41 /DNA_END=562 /DNA_ORIENTATION=-
MTREITELSGYPVKMLVKVHQKQLKDQDSAQSKIQSTPKVLPLLDEYEFENSGGLSGRVYGIPGLAEGTKIETSAVVDVQVTLPRGFVQTQDDLVAYELGLPLRESYSLDGISRNKPQLSTTIIRDAAGEIVKTQVTGDDMLVRLGATTAILLAGATAVNMLSHHLTVNVFWV